MRPLLHPSLGRVWRDESTVQIGLKPDHAVILGGLGQIDKMLLRALDGRHDMSALRLLATVGDGDPSCADRLIRMLADAGVIVDGAHDTNSETDTGGRTHRDLEPDPDAASLALVARDVAGGRHAMVARGRCRVDVLGAGRVGAGIARLLAAAGIGEVCVEDPEPTTSADISPGGLGRDALGRARDRALDDVIRAERPGRQQAARAADLVVLAPVAGTGRDQAAQLLKDGIPHLLAQVVETTGIVGPLVLPGESSCLRCHDLHRTDRDSGWPVVLDQAARNPPTRPACDAGLAAAVGGLATAQALGHLDGFEVATRDGTIELDLPYGLPRRRSWTAHPACGCMWSKLR
ncbi:MAG TPA: hypothetical protein VFQ15_04115 [Jiangellaceae bacterium]|nr:hypothetical protein [Jiangellaceae bacterium]